MQIPFMDIKELSPEIYDDILNKLQEIISSGNFIGGDEVNQFEQKFAKFCGVKYAIGCGNGTDALIIALKALGIGLGDGCHHCSKYVYRYGRSHFRCGSKARVCRYR